MADQASATAANSAPASVASVGGSCAVCGAEAHHRCARCKLAHYCTPAHQQAHWSSGAHKFSCPVLRTEASLDSSDVSKQSAELDTARRIVEAELYSAVPGRRILDSMLAPSPKLKELEGGDEAAAADDDTPVQTDIAGVLGCLRAMLALLGSPNAAIVQVAARDICRVFEAVAYTGDLAACVAVLEAIPTNVGATGAPLAPGSKEPSLRTVAAAGAEPVELDSSFPALNFRFAGTAPLVAAASAGSVPVAQWLLVEHAADPNRPHPARKWTALQHACHQGGALGLVELLLSHGANPTGEPDLARTAKHLPGRFGYTGSALAHACETRVEEDRVTIVKRLLAALPAGAAWAPDSSDRRPVDFAAAAANLDVFKALVEAGADPSPVVFTFAPAEGVSEGELEGAAGLASTRTSYLHLAASEDSAPFLEGALQVLADRAAAGKGPGGPVGPTGVPLAFVNLRGSDGSTPLHRACTFDTLECAKVLLAAGADVTTKTRVTVDFQPAADATPADQVVELSPLAAALVNGSAKCVEALTRGGHCDPNEVVTLPGTTTRRVPMLVVAFIRREVAAVATMRARMTLESAHADYKALQASLRVATARAEAMLREAGARVTEAANALQFEHTTTEGIDAAMKAFLDEANTPALDLGARMEGDEGWTVLHWVLDNTVMPQTALQVLGRGGAAHINTASTVALNGWPVGTTPLHVAARFGRTEVVKAVLEAGASAEARDAEGRTPIIVAATSPNMQSLELLLGRGVTAAQLRYSGEGAVKTAVDAFDAAMTGIKAKLGAAYDGDAALKRTVENLRGTMVGVLASEVDAASLAAAEAARAALEKEEAEAAARKAAKAAKKAKAGAK